jgi:hypothetical protein
VDVEGSNPFSRSVVMRDRSFVSVVRGRILYRDVDTQPFIVLRHDRSGRFFLVEDGWTDESACAGPFEPNDVLRAWRIANVRVPDGCERGPWQWGIALFDPAPLPDRADAWSRFDAAWLPPSVSTYSDSDMDAVVNEVCCAPPHDAPHVDRIGVLRRAWNAHPVGSPVFERSDARFVVVDLPPPA